MKKYFFGNHRFVLYGPEMVDGNELHREQSMPEQRQISETVGQIQKLDAIFDQRTIEARQLLLRIEAIFEERVGLFSPEKRAELAQRIDHVYGLIRALEESRDFSIDKSRYDNDPLAFKERRLEDERNLQKTIEKFGVPGLKLVQAEAGTTAANRVEYGIALNGAVLGNIIIFETGKEISSEASLVEQIGQLLVQHRIPHQKVESAEFAGLPYEVRIDAETRSFLEGFQVKVTKNGVDGIFRPGDFSALDVTWNAPATKTVEFRILSQADGIWKLNVTDKDGTQDAITCKGNIMLDLQQ